jgi:hypothetical protein
MSDTVYNKIEKFKQLRTFTTIMETEGDYFTNAMVVIDELAERLEKAHELLQWVDEYVEGFEDAELSENVINGLDLTDIVQDYPKSRAEK